MMNADLAAVSKKHGMVGYPLRNRSASSNSGDGRPDPTRYTKYLSLRNRQIVEAKQKVFEDSSSQHTASLRAQENFQDLQKPLQPILKSTSSRVQDLRFRDSSLHKTASNESLPPIGLAQEQATRTANHSPLRIKSQCSSKERERSPTRNGGPIEVYQKEPAVFEDNQQRKGATFSHHTESASNFRSAEQQSARKKHFEKSRQTDPFKSTTQLGTETDFNFDLDQDGACSSYVNTTVKSEHVYERAATTPKVQQLSNFKPMKPDSTSKKSISAYTEELKLKVEQMSACGVDNVSEEEIGLDESSDYVIDYEQVLKDNQIAYAPSPVQYREDLGHTTILEQTQEANDSDSTPDETSVSSRQQDSPQFRDENIQDNFKQRKSNCSPVIGGGGDYKVRSRNQSIDEEEQPILTFENRQGSLSSMIIPEKQRIFGQNGKSQISSNETNTFRAPQSKKPTQSQALVRDQRSQREISEPEESYTDRTEPIAQKTLQQQAVFKKNTLLGATDSHTPTQERRTQFSEIDLVASTEKFKERNREINEEFERQSIGSQPPLSNLIVTCIIRQPMDTVGIKNKYRHLQSGNQFFSSEKDKEIKILTTSRTSVSFPTTGSIKQGISNSVGPIINRNNVLNKSVNGLDITKSSSFSGNRNDSRVRHLSQDSRSNLSAGGTKKKSQVKAAAKDSLPNSYKHPHILTTQIPSNFVLRSPPGLQAQLLNILLKSEQDIKHCQLAFDEYGVQHQAKSRKTMKVFEFDNCVGETKGHSLQMGLDEHVKWITQTRSAQNQAKNVIFLFGQTDALKHQLLNVMQPNSLINQCLKTKEIRFLRVSMYHLNQEHLLAHKSFGNKQQMRREIGMELREAFRERDLNAKKIALRLSTYQKTLRAEDVKLGSHLIIQLDDLVFVDLADIDNLKDTSMAKKISADFSVVTNSILTMSPFYKDHDFGKVEEDRLAPYMDTNSFRSGSLTFKNQISRLITKRSKVLLLCCVIQCSVAGTQAVDYCHKIRTYFHGSTMNNENTHFNKTPTRRMQQVQGDISMETDQNVNAFKQLGGLISEVTKARLFIDQVFTNKPQGGEPLKRMRAQLKDMVSCLRDDVSDLLNSLAANNESYVQQLMKIREMLQIQISNMRDKVSALRSVNRRGSASSNRSRHKICVLPKTMLQQHQSVQVQKNIQPLQSPLYLQQKEDQQQPSSTQHNQRPGSQTSLNSGTNASRPQSSRFSGIQRPSQPAIGPRRVSKTSLQKNTQNQRNNSFSQSRKTTASKNAANSTPQEHRTPVHKDGMSSSIKQRMSHESLNNEKAASGTRQSESGVSSKEPKRRSSGGKASRNQNNYSRQQTASNNGTFTNSKNNQDLDKVVSAREHRGPQILEHQSKSYSTQSFAFEAEDFRKQTLQSLNQNYILSGTKASAIVPESTSTPTGAYPLATTELLHQEVFDLKEQLRRATEQIRQAIQLSEEQATKRRQAEEKCIQLTKEVSQKEQQCKDLQERIIAKDQTIRSLESQLDFMKHRNLVSKHDSNRQMFTAEDTQNLEEINVLKQQKAETDQMNQEILGQITMLKEAISSFQNQELKNQLALQQQSSKDQEMEELKAQVKQLMQAQQREPSPNLEILQLRQELQELHQTKEKYREEALFIKQEIRQARQMNPKPTSKERKRSLSSHSRRKESQDKEPLQMHSKLTNSQQLQQQDQQVHPQPQTFTQQKSLSTIKNMIRDFKEQRKSLIKTTGSRETIIQGTASLKNQMHGNKTQNHRSSRSRENDEREKFKGYAQLNSHFR